MAAVDRKIGQGGYVGINGTAVPNWREFTIEPTADVVDSSAGSQAYKTYIAALKDATASLVYVYEGTAAGTTFLAYHKVGTTVTLLWGPEGSVAGKPKGSNSAIVTGHSKPMKYDDLVLRTVSYQFTGDPIFDDEEDVF